ncbi:hypothetical protein HanXRQr2_Chr16g0754441 [Helianthus annuus]|uniref:Uncharacterized protein n=1 Tax=Helianthus annuus TaxID=4232 RepID=A0A9K3DTI5_HELAN|nr:hypothetical protein HanXRQr2_Chr16g0754441 [Helianthus annuus]KAJ0443348.1 hypothetical protein HanIR_Chr16g0819751 [Helianthus annuus]KAJ0821680.1 hypothetical protein HanPSC8_Chr16g0723091 [Helianthus annuus]
MKLCLKGLLKERMLRHTVDWFLISMKLLKVSKNQKSSAPESSSTPSWFK